jgi:hypothetical protein
MKYTILSKLASFSNSFFSPKEPNGNGAPPTNKAAFVGGPKVHFGGEEEQHEEAAGTSGGASGAAKAQFERKNTPHPKPSVGGGTSSGGATGTAAAAAKHHKKQQVDGHIVHRMGEVICYYYHCHLNYQINT